MREWEQQAKQYERLAGLSRHEQKLVESSGLPPGTALALVASIKDKGAREAQAATAALAAEAARLKDEATAYRLEDDAERLAETARVNDALFDAWRAEQDAERERRETWEPPTPMGQLRP